MFEKRSTTAVPATMANLLLSFILSSVVELAVAKVVVTGPNQLEHVQQWATREELKTHRRIIEQLDESTAKGTTQSLHQGGDEHAAGLRPPSTQTFVSPSPLLSTSESIA